MAEVRQGQGPKFAMVPLQLMDADWSDAYHAQVYASLRATADFGEAGESTTGCYEKISNLADRAGCSPRTFHDRAADLKERGWIEWNSGRDVGGRNEYVVHFSPASDAEGSARDAEGSARDADPTNIEPNTENQNQDTNWEEMGRSEQLEASSPDQPCPIIRSVFDHCRGVRADRLDKQGGPPLQLTQKRHSKIRARLQEGFSAEQLECAYEGMLSRDFFVDNGHTDVELAFRDDEKVRRHMKWYAQNVESESGGSSSVRYWDE